jgi:hypothetical protein
MRRLLLAQINNLSFEVSLTCVVRIIEPSDFHSTSKQGAPVEACKVIEIIEQLFVSSFYHKSFVFTKLQ